MYVNPNSTIILCKNVPLDTTYEHTLYFDNIGLQTAYFRSKAKTTFNNQTYQRVVRGKIRLQVCADDIYDCNYLMYQNTNYGSKWFYAFITGIEYINNITSEITFDIDSMQTYFFDVELRQCFVEREHVSDDTIGLHTLPEKVDCSEMIPMDQFNFLFGRENTEELSTKWRVKLTIKPNEYMTTLDYLFNQYPMQYSENQITLPEYSGDADDVTSIQAFLTNQSISGADIVNIEMYPEFFEHGNVQLDVASYGIKRPTRFYMPDIQGETSYTPKNNKLFTFPYTYLLVDNNDGAQKIFKWEDMYGGGANYCTFFLLHNISNEVGCWLEYRSYQNGFLRPTRLGLTNFPKVPVAVGDLAKTISHALTSVGEAALVSALPVAPQLSVVDLPLEAMSQNLDKPENQMLGAEGLSMVSAIFNPAKQSGGFNKNIELKYNEIGFSFYVMGIKPEFAKIIDNYFNLRGYQVNTVKVPNRAVRQHWTYTKTKGCIVVGNAPSDDIRKICNIYDKGITFWRSPEYVGQYQLSNPIIT